MKALCWFGKRDVRVADAPDPRILSPGDAIVRITSTAICGSDLHLYNGFIPAMKKGDILGHEFMGEVVETGVAVKRLRVGDRVVVPFTISCGRCHFCLHDQWSLCDNTNPNSRMAAAANGYSGAGIYGYSHIYGGYAGGQAQYARVPFADFGPIKIESDLTDDEVLFLSDIFPTGYQAAEQCGIRPGHTVAVWGCGPVGQFAIRSAFLLGASKVIAIDSVPERMELARQAGAFVIESGEDVLHHLQHLTGGRGPDACIDSVGMESHGSGYDFAKQKARLETDRPHVLREAIMSCRKGGVVSVPGVYGGLLDKIPLGAAFAKGLTFRMGQTHVQRYMRPLLDRIERNEIDPTFLITHRLALADAPNAYKIFLQKQQGCIKVVMDPWAAPRLMAGEEAARGGWIPESQADQTQPRSKRLRRQ